MIFPLLAHLTLAHLMLRKETDKLLLLFSDEKKDVIIVLVGKFYLKRVGRKTNLK